MTTEQHTEASVLLSKIYQLEAHLEFMKSIEYPEGTPGVVPMIVCPFILADDDHIKHHFYAAKTGLRQEIENHIKRAKERLSEI